MKPGSPPSWPATPPPENDRHDAPRASGPGPSRPGRTIGPAGSLGSYPRGGLEDCAVAMDARDIEQLIKAGIPDAKVTMRDLAGDGDHYSAEVVAGSFRGKSRVQQHQM